MPTDQFTTDHSHARQHVGDASRWLHRVLTPGALVAFHDYADTRNFDGDIDYCVFQGIEDGLSERFSFIGCFGCMGVYQFCNRGVQGTRRDASVAVRKEVIDYFKQAPEHGSEPSAA